MKNKLKYYRSKGKTSDKLPWFKELRDKKYKLIYGEFNGSNQIITAI